MHMRACLISSGNMVYKDVMPVKKISILIALLFLSVHPAGAEEIKKLSWPPPPQHQPTHIDVTAGSKSGTIDLRRSIYPYDTSSVTTAPLTAPVTIKLKQDEDAVITLPKDKILPITGLGILRGRHVRIIGGHLKAVASADKSLRALLRFAGQSGSVFVEGLVLDANNQYGLDGLDVGSVKDGPHSVADIYVQNCIIRGVYSTREGLHADAFQYYGDTGWTRMDRVSIVSQYQGLFLDPQNDMKGVDLRRVDMRYADPATGQGYIFFLRTETGRDRHPPVSLQDVYAGTRTNRSPWQEFSIYPPASRKGGGVFKDGRVSFPSYPEVTGYVMKGAPPGGAWVKDKDAGLHYTSPGYANP
jgi:hypothetical protein